MESFVFKNETAVIFGADTEKQVGELVRKHSHKILLHSGMGSARKSGLLDRVEQSLRDAGVRWVELPGVVPNPRLSLVQKGIELCRKEGLDFILAVGGGSVIDSAKAIAAGVPYQGDVWDFYMGVTQPASALKLGTVLTIPAAGSETSGSTVITKEDGLLKRGLTDNDHLRPVFSIMNPALTCTLSPRDTAIGAADIMSHVMERYFTNTRAVDFSDRLCEATMVSVRRNLPRVLANPMDYDARAELMWTGTLAHNDLFGMGREGDWASHGIEHELSALYDIPHGAGLAIVFPAWMKYVYRHDVARFAQWANRVWQVEADFGNPEACALEGIRRFEDFYRSSGLPVRLSDLKLDGKDIQEMANKATGHGKWQLGSFVKLDKAAVVKILELAL